MPAEDLNGHVRLAARPRSHRGRRVHRRAQPRPRVSQQGGCTIMQAECGRIGGITPWLRPPTSPRPSTCRSPPFPDGAARLAGRRRAERPLGRVHPQLDDLTLRQVTIQDGYRSSSEPASASIGLGRDCHPARPRADDAGRYRGANEPGGRPAASDGRLADLARRGLEPLSPLPDPQGCYHASPILLHIDRSKTRLPHRGAGSRG